MNIKYWFVIVFGVLMILIGFLILNDDNEIKDPDLLHVLSITNCDSLRSDKIFQNHNKLNWTLTKPENVVEAILHMDSMTNQFTKHLFRLCDPNDFHFGVGMTIRNQWVYKGQDKLNNQLFNTLKLDHHDSSSGLILFIFREYLKDGEINLMDQLGKHMSADSMKSARSEIEKIETELNVIKKKNSG